MTVPVRPMPPQQWTYTTPRREASLDGLRDLVVARRRRPRRGRGSGTRSGVGRGARAFATSATSGSYGSSPSAGVVRSTNVRTPQSTSRSTLLASLGRRRDVPGTRRRAAAPARPTRRAGLVVRPEVARRRRRRRPTNSPRARATIRSPATTFSRHAAGMPDAPQRAPAIWPAIAAVVSASSPRFAARSTAPRKSSAPATAHSAASSASTQ